MPQQESSRGNNNNIGYGDSHRQNSISNYAEKDQFLGNSSFKHSGHHGPLEHSSLNVPHGSNSNSGGNTHGHSSHHSQHNSHHHHGSSSSNHADYLSAGDTSDGEDIPVLEIDLSA